MSARCDKCGSKVWPEDDFRCITCERDALRHRVRDLEAALVPFSLYAGHLSSMEFNNTDVVHSIVYGGCRMDIQAEAFFNARTAVTETPT